MSKGISPLIAAVLLIAFTVAIATLVAGWFSTLTGSTTDKVSNTTDLAVDCAAASISIDEVFLNNGDLGTARAIIRNNGFTNVSVISAQLFNTTGNNFTTSTSLPANLDRGNITQLAFSPNISGTCPTGFSQVVITTNCGGVGDTFDGTPKCF